MVGAGDIGGEVAEVDKSLGGVGVVGCGRGL